MPITDIKEQFAKVIAYSQRLDEVNIDNLFEQWAKAKSPIISAWDGKYIYEVPEPVSFELGPEEKRFRVNEFISVVEGPFNNRPLANFLEWLTTREIFNNKMERDYWIAPTDKISAGTKVIKAFKHFEDDEYILRDLQDRLSMILQEDKVSGTLCFSVHPLDFLSASENNHGWRSCHALDGDFRAGNLSYLLDESTVICYLRKQGEMVKLPNFPEDVPWNSKKWRMWLFLSDDWDALFAGRQYPFFSNTALEIVQRYFINSIGKSVYHWSHWYDDFMCSFPRETDYSFGSETDLNGRHVSMRYEVYKMKNLVTDCENPLHYNDLLESSCYIPYYCWQKAGRKRIHFSIGHSVPCLCCGEELIKRSDTMVCEKCNIIEDDNYYSYCDHCDTRQVRDTLIWVESAGQYLCETCYDAFISRCGRCGCDWYDCDLTYDYDTEQYLCPYCNGRNKEEL